MSIENEVRISQKAADMAASERDLLTAAARLADEAFQLRVKEQKLLLELSEVRAEITKKAGQRLLCVISANAIGEQVVFKSRTVAQNADLAGSGTRKSLHVNRYH